MSNIELLTSSQAAEVLHVGRNTITNMVARGEIAAAAFVRVTRNGAYLFDPAEVERVAALRAKKTETAK